MYTHILIPTDGTTLSENAMRSAMKLAKALSARVTGFHVVPTTFLFEGGEAIVVGSSALDEFAAMATARANDYLAVVEREAKAAGVSCTTLTAASDSPYEAIIGAADKAGCDLIAMASHGRKGLEGVLMGSETVKVLTHSTIPVLVYR